MDTPSDNRSDIRDFLATRRARLTPEQAGLLPGGNRRRVPGLRREEVAVLAGVSTEWYTRLEKGHIAGVSEDVLEAVARALQLDEAEHTYLFDLARAARPARRTPPRRKPSGRPAERAVDARLDDRVRGLGDNGRLDILAINPLGRALYSATVRPDRRGWAPANFARFKFLDPAGAGLLHRLGRRRRHHRRAAPRRSRPRTRTTRRCVSSSVSCPPSARHSAPDGPQHNIRLHHGGIKRFHHPDGRRPRTRLPDADLSTDGPGRAHPDGLHRRTRQPLRGSASSSSPAGPRPTTPRTPRPDIRRNAPSPCCSRSLAESVSTAHGNAVSNDLKRGRFPGSGGRI